MTPLEQRLADALRECLWNMHGQDCKAAHLAGLPIGKGLWIKAIAQGEAALEAALNVKPASQKPQTADTGMVLVPSEPVAWMGRGTISFGPVFALPHEPRSELCAPWQPVYLHPPTAIDKTPAMWRWIDEKDRPMTVWLVSEPPPESMREVSDTRGKMRVEFKSAAIDKPVTEGTAREIK